MYIMSFVSTIEVDYGYDHFDVVFSEEGDEIEMGMTCIEGNLYQADTFLGECSQCEMSTNKVYVGKLSPDHYIIQDTEGSKYRCYIYGFKCTTCYDHIFDHIIGDEFYD